MNTALTVTFFINFASNTLVKLSGYPKRSPQGLISGVNGKAIHLQDVICITGG